MPKRSTQHFSILATALLTGLLLSTSSASRAAEVGDASGVYLGLSAGSANGSADLYKRDGSHPSLGVALGYRINQTLSVELFARGLNFALFSYLLENNPPYYPDSHIGAALLADLPLSESFSLYGRLGAGSTKMVNDQVKNPAYRITDYSVGAGLSYAFGHGWSSKLEILRLTRSEVNVASLGLEYRF